MLTRITTWWRRRRDAGRLVHTPSQAEQDAAHRAARRRLLDEAERQRQEHDARHWESCPPMTVGQLVRSARISA